MLSKLETIPTYQVVYIRHIGPYGSENIKTINKIKIWAQQQNLLDDDATILGIAQDNPSNTNSEDCRYDACLVISDEQRIAGCEIGQGSVTGGQYLVFEIEHTEEAVQKAWAGIFQELAKKHYQLDELRPIIERYKRQMIEKNSCEICVPVQSK